MKVCILAALVTFLGTLNPSGACETRTCCPTGKPVCSFNGGELPAQEIIYASSKEPSWASHGNTKHAHTETKETNWRLPPALHCTSEKGQPSSEAVFTAGAKFGESSEILLHLDGQNDLKLMTNLGEPLEADGEWDWSLNWYGALSDAGFLQQVLVKENQPGPAHQYQIIFEYDVAHYKQDILMDCTDHSSE
jgi:hypothetical protein